MNCNDVATDIHMACSNILLASHFNTALGSSGDEAVLDLEETPTLRDLRSRSYCRGINRRHHCIERGCKWIRRRSGDYCDHRNSSRHDRFGSACRDRGRKSCTNKSYCRWSSRKDRCVDRHRGKFCPLLFYFSVF